MDHPRPEELKRRAAEIFAAAEDVADSECRATLYQLALLYGDLADKLVLLSSPLEGSDTKPPERRP